MQMFSLIVRHTIHIAEHLAAIASVGLLEGFTHSYGYDVRLWPDWAFIAVFVAILVLGASLQRLFTFWMKMVRAKTSEPQQPTGVTASTKAGNVELALALIGGFTIGASIIHAAERSRAKPAESRLVR